MPYDIALAEAMRLALKRRRNVVEKKMFGGYCWMLNGNMLCGVEVGRYMFRVGKALEAEALSRPGARPMDITGKPMAGFVWVDAKHAGASKLSTWIELAAKYVGSLPAK
jgi:TfoX/Sxy family transcriptional regulator of competence genes